MGDLDGLDRIMDGNYYKYQPNRSPQTILLDGNFQSWQLREIADILDKQKEEWNNANQISS